MGFRVMDYQQYRTCILFRTHEYHTLSFQKVGCTLWYHNSTDCIQTVYIPSFQTFFLLCENSINSNKLDSWYLHLYL